MLRYIAPSIEEYTVETECGFACSPMLEDPDEQPEQEW